MSADKGTAAQGRQPYKPSVSTTRTTASPLTPRLAANAIPTARPTSPKRLLTKTNTPSPATSRPNFTSTQTPTPTTTTQARPRNGDSITPLSLARGRTTTTSTTAHTMRSKPAPPSRTASPLTTARSTITPTAAPTLRVATFDRPASAGPEPTSASSRARSPLGTLERATPSPLARTGGARSVESSMFFHANEVMSQDPPKARPAFSKSSPSFLYADGRQDQDSTRSTDRSLSPASDRPSLSPRPSHNLQHKPNSPTNLSAPLLTQSPFGNRSRPVSPLADAIDAPAVEGSLNVAKRRLIPSLSTFIAPTLDRTYTGLSTSPGHTKSSSTSAVVPESPSALRKRSVTWTEANNISQSPTMTSPRHAERHELEASNPTSPVRAKTLSSPQLDMSPTITDMAAEARRERKVLDLEISNSSLLAINRSLEREIKKQKTELKRFRRLSRAGRFSSADLHIDEDEMDHDQNGAKSRAVSYASLTLLGIPDAPGRPSSPFDVEAQELVSGSSEEDSGSDEASDRADGDEQVHGSTTQIGRQRARDEARLRRDLRKHRELLLDTARTNRSLQRCLTWTEDLIKHGRKALDHAGGSRVRPVADEDDEDEFETLSPEDRVLTPVGEAEDASVNATTAMEAFVKIPGPWTREGADVASARTDRDSGIEIIKSA